MADLTSHSHKLPVLGQAEAPTSGFSRRNFLQLAGGAAAAAGLSACRPPHDVVYPYVTKPEDVVPGTPMRYASALTSHAGIAAGVLVTAWEGRPTKVEGNP